jgi:acyl phosphate:glycerol-3-phosphate acyltransferase
MVWMYVLSAVAGYLVGCISFGYITGKIFKGKDIREVGSGNAGTANVIRNYGWVPGLITFSGDVLKGIVAALIGKAICGWYGTEEAVWIGACIAGLAAVIGHIWPVFLKFKGGKGVATTFGVFLAIMTWNALIVFLLCVVIIAITRTMSIGSLVGTALMAACSIFFCLATKEWGLGIPVWLQITTYWIPVTCVALVALVFYSHRANLKRLAEGKENQL